MDRNLAAVVARARRAAGLSQADLARRAGISASYLSRIEGAAWERGGPWPADSVLRALARALGLSSTDLVALRQEARARHDLSVPSRSPARAGRRVPYAVSVGAAEVELAARGVVDRNPARGTLRTAQVYVLDQPGDPGAPSYIDALADRVTATPETVLYRVCGSTARHRDLLRSTVDRLAGPNVRTRVVVGNPLVLDVLVGDHEALIAVPDRRGHPHLGACVVVDDPDFVAALRDWFDEAVWDPPSGAEQHLNPAGARGVRPGPYADVLEGGREDVVAVAR